MVRLLIEQMRTGETVDSFGVTLLVGGAWITGTVVTDVDEALQRYRDWFEGTPTNSEGFVEGVLKGIDTWKAERVSTSPAQDEDDGGTRAESLETLVLFDARLVTSQGNVPEKGTIIEVRADRIQAWTLGNFS